MILNASDEEISQGNESVEQQVENFDKINDWMRSNYIKKFSNPQIKTNKELNNKSTTEPVLKYKLSSPSKEQLIARKSINTDLPIFYGKTEEWEGFISYYEMTTEVCGFNEVDNMLRLKRSLKGEAFETV